MNPSPAVAKGMSKSLNAKKKKAKYFSMAFAAFLRAVASTAREETPLASRLVGRMTSPLALGP